MRESSNIFFVLTLLLYYTVCYTQSHISYLIFVYDIFKYIISLRLQRPKKTLDSVSQNTLVLYRNCMTISSIKSLILTFLGMPVLRHASMQWNGTVQRTALSVNQVCSKIRSSLIASAWLCALSIYKWPDIFLQMQHQSTTELSLSDLSFYHHVRAPLCAPLYSICWNQRLLSSIKMCNASNPSEDRDVWDVFLLFLCS